MNVNFDVYILQYPVLLQENAEVYQPYSTMIWKKPVEKTISKDFRIE